MAQTINLTPKFKIPTAENELMLQPGIVPMGNQQGGLNMYSNKFKRGYGDAVFGSDENGIWLGGAEYPDAPFKVSMDGKLAAKSATFIDENDTTVIDSKGLVSTSQFVSASYTATEDATGFGNSPSYNDVAGSELTFTLARTTRMLFLANGLVQFEDDGITPYVASAHLVITLDNIIIGHSQLQLAMIDFAEVGGSGVPAPVSTISVQSLINVSAGNHAVKLQVSKSSNIIGHIQDRSLIYVTLGS